MVSDVCEMSQLFLAKRSLFSDHKAWMLTTFIGSKSTGVQRRSFVVWYSSLNNKISKSELDSKHGNSSLNTSFVELDTSSLGMNCWENILINHLHSVKVLTRCLVVVCSH